MNSNKYTPMNEEFPVSAGHKLALIKMVYKPANRIPDGGKRYAQLSGLAR